DCSISVAELKLSGAIKHLCAIRTRRGRRSAEKTKENRMKMVGIKMLTRRGQEKARRGFSGFTLIETVVSLPIAAIAIVSLYACFSQGFSVIGQERENLRATQIMVKQLERIRVCPFDQLTNSVYNPQTLTDYFDPTDQPGGGGGTTYSVTFTPSVPA